jgi:dTDP-4-amino-4,6-dideoxygalactose transaminase
MQVRFGDLAREYAEIQPEIDAAIGRVLRRGWFVLGEELEAFEAAFAGYAGAAHCVGCASGTDAIALALLACEVGPGDEVITVAHTAVPTATAISMVGARPVFVDIHAHTCLMDVARVEDAITSRTRAILPVHLYGQCVDMDPLLEIGRRHGIPVVEDCAQAHGAAYRGRRAGSMGLLGTFSFYPSKNLGCYGDGGAVVTSDAALATRLRMLRNYGQRQRYYHEIKGMNSRLDELQAAILGAKLPHLESWNARRQGLAAYYSHRLGALPLRTPACAEGNEHVYHLYVIQCQERAALQEHLAAQGIQTLVHYPVPIHLQEAYADLGYRPGALPVTERVAASIVSLPIYPQLQEEEAAAVIAAMREFYVRRPQAQ